MREKKKRCIDRNVRVYDSMTGVVIIRHCLSFCLRVFHRNAFDACSNLEEKKKHSVSNGLSAWYWCNWENRFQMITSSVTSLHIKRGEKKIHIASSVRIWNECASFENWNVPIWFIGIFFFKKLRTRESTREHERARIRSNVCIFQIDDRQIHNGP